jgi:LacI family transcriptional regulator/LacI family sucrose operon transcriptional repressor
MASIRDVAKLAGVSPSTVSRVMNNTARVDEEKRKRVLDAIEQTGFQPNELARALFKQSSRIIGVIVSSIVNPFFSEMVRAIEEEAFEYGYRILICDSNGNVEKEKMNIHMLNQMKADGLIMMAQSEMTSQIIKDCQMPVVVLDRRVSGDNVIASVYSDHYGGGRKAAQHLLDCGCKHLVCVRGPQNASSGKDRYVGYRDFCREFNIAEQIIEGDYSYDKSLETANAILEQYPDVDGIFACNDMAAFAICKVLQEKGYHVPEDIQVVGYDNIMFSRLFAPEITTIHQPIHEMGQLAVRIIVQHINGEEYEKNNNFDVELIERQSTKKR